MRCYLFMVSFTVADRSTICVLEENIGPALEELIEVDPTDKWTLEDLITRFARKETVTKDDVTVGYILVSVPENTVEVSMKEDGGETMLDEIRKIAEKHGFKFVN